MKIEITKNPEEAILPFEKWRAIAHDAYMDAVSNKDTIKAIYGADVPQSMLGKSNRLSDNTAYIIRATLKGGYSFFHVTYREKTLNDKAAARKRFGDPNSLD